jgi:hypothetical protein
LQKRGFERTKVAQDFAAQVLADLQGKGQCGKEAFLLKSVFGYFCATKVTKPSGYERNDDEFQY